MRRLKQVAADAATGEAGRTPPGRLPVTGPRAGEALHHLPPHLREVCAVLALGLVRLRRRTAEDLARDAALGRGSGEVPLHFTAGRSVHADPLERADPA
jgi:hypothetical protein